MDVSEAVDSRLSVREFLKNPVDDELIKELLEKSAQKCIRWQSTALGKYTLSTMKLWLLS